MTKKQLDHLTYTVLGAAIEVHKELGPGLLESVYHRCLAHEFRLKNIEFYSQQPVPVAYKEMPLEVDLRCDFCVESCLIIELKAAESLLPVHEAQLLTYMKLLQIPKGLLINFNCSNIIQGGQKTFVNEIFRNLPDG